MKLYLAINLSSETWLTEIIEKLGSGCGIVNKTYPHITIFPPVSVVADEYKSLIERLATDEKLLNIAPFNVQTTGLGRFGSKVVYMGIQKTDELLYLRSRVFEIFGKSESNSFTPHITLAKGLFPSKSVQVIEFLTDMRGNVRFAVPPYLTISSINIYGKTTDETSWIPKGLVNFNG